MRAANAPFEVTLQEAAAEDLEALDPEVRRRILVKLNWLAASAEQTRHDSLGADLAGLSKRRVGDYRVIYQLLPRERRIIVHRISHRRSAYGGS